VKFGGSPTDTSNKTAIQAQAHRSYVTPWWNKIKKDVTKGLGAWDKSPRRYIGKLKMERIHRKYA